VVASAVTSGDGAFSVQGRPGRDVRAHRHGLR
jgi:hypothetical protein